MGLNVKLFRLCLGIGFVLSIATAFQNCGNINLLQNKEVVAASQACADLNSSRPAVAGKPFVRLTTGTWYIKLKNVGSYTKAEHLVSQENPEGYICGWSSVYLAAWKCGTRIATSGPW